MKKYQYLLGLCIAALLMPVLSSCEDDSLFFRTGSMSKLAFTVSTADDNGGSASTRGVVHVVDYFVDEEGDTLYLACKIVDMDQPAAADSPATRGKYITGANLASVYGEFNVSAYREGKISRPLKETDGDGNQLTNAQSYVGVTFSAREKSDGTHTQQTDGTNPVWEATSSSLDNYYWPKNESLTFYAYAPTTTVVSGPSWTGLTPADNYKDNGVIEFDYTVPVSSSTPRVDAEKQPDILVSSVDKKRSELSEYEEDTDTKYAIVPLKFYHALCAVEFHANRKADELLKEGVTVTSVSLGNLKGSGTCTFTPSSTGSKSADFISWDFTDVTDNEGNYSQAFTFTNTDAADNIDAPLDASTDPATAFMLIPQKVGGGSSATDSDSPEASVTLGYKTSATGPVKTKSISLHKDNAYEWKAGKKYIYHLTGDLTSLTLDGSVLSWDTKDAKLPIRHYVLNASKKELTFDDLFAEQTRTFDVLSYYYTGDTDDGTTRTAVNCKVEYEDADGNWQELESSDFGYTSAPYLGSSDDAGVTPAYSSLSHLYDATLDDALTEGTGMTFALSADRGTDAAGLLESANLSELVFTDDATVASGWDLSLCGVGGEYSSSNSRNTANCYIVKHPGSYTFPLVYGNAIKNGDPNASAYTTSLISATTYTGAVLQNFVNFAGLKVQNTNQFNDDGTVKYDKGQEKLDDNKNPGYILPNIKNMNMASIGQTGTNAFKKTKIIAGAEKDLGGGVKIYEYTYLNATLLWQDEAGMISNVQLVGVKDHPESAYISFETAGASTLKQCNALIGLYVDADADGTLDNGEPIVWSWHIWVTNADLSNSAATMVSRTSVPSNTNGMKIDYSGNYTFMPRDLGECDMNGAYLKTLKSSYAWLDGMNLRISQVEGDAKPQIITIHQPGKEIHPKPYAPLYQWGRKDPFGGHDLNNLGDLTLAAAKKLYDEAGDEITIPTATIGSSISHYSNNTDRIGSIAQTIKRPLEMRVISTTTPTSSSYTLFYNCWNNNINSGLNFGSNSTSLSFTYLGSPIKTIYDPCPYGYLVPDERAYLAFDPQNTWDVKTSSVFYSTQPTFMALAKTSIPNGAVTLLDANGAENERMIFPCFNSRYEGGFYARAPKRQTSSLDSYTQPLSLEVVLPNSYDTNHFLHVTSSLPGYTVRPVRE